MTAKPSDVIGSIATNSSFFAKCVERRQSIATLLLIIPCLLVLLWHQRNYGLPTDDAADYAKTALEISKQFERGSTSGLLAVLHIRGWRPIAFPPLAVPFLLMNGNDVVAGCAATLLLIHFCLTLYLYRLARLLTADAFIAAAACSFVLSVPAIVRYSMVFYSESAWLLCSVAFVYHLLRSGPFKSVMHSLSAGVFGGLMTAIRPAESSVVLVIWIALVIVNTIRSKQVSIRTSVVVLTPFIICGLVLLISTWIPGITRSYVLEACFVAVALGIPLSRRYNPALVSFLVALSSLACFWWAGFMPALFAWVYQTSFGPLVRTSDGLLRPALPALTTPTLSYGWIQTGFLAVTTIVLIVSRGVPLLKKRSSRTLEISRLGCWLLIASGIILTLLGALYGITGTADPRRVLVALVLFITPLAVIIAINSRLALVALLCLTGVQWVLIGKAVAKAPISGIAGLGAVPVPHGSPDGNLETVRLLAMHVPAGSGVAVYTLTLFRSDARVYEPAALNLASLHGNYGLNFAYILDSSIYEDVLTRFRKGNCEYLLLDSFGEIEPASSHLPYVQFASELLRRSEDGTFDPPALSTVVRFKLGDREHTLFRLLPQ